ncbi:hypothetical protein ACC741_37840, partial [Rhizobium johnstonii]|uniref:hypothetical protein n=1 Tax=Rhizobium johnstonii TaxID=3019933 RepID=UPI003F9E140C
MTSSSALCRGSAAVDARDEPEHYGRVVGGPCHQPEGRASSTFDVRSVLRERNTFQRFREFRDWNLHPLVV